MRKVFYSLVGGAALCASGCVSVLPAAAPPSARFTIAAVDFSSPAEQQVAWSLAIADPSATRAYDTTKIALTHSQGQIEYYASGEWADRAPILVSTVLQRSFENSGSILSIGDAISLPGADYFLQTDIRSLHVEYDNQQGKRERSTAKLEFYVRLADRRGRILAAHRFIQSEPLTDDSETAAARAFDTAMSRMLNEILPWTIEAASAASQKTN